MEALQSLLFRGLYRHGQDPAAAARFQQRLRIRAVGLIPTHVRPDVLRGQQDRDEPERVTRSPPLMRRTTRFHDDFRADRQGCEEPLELRPGQPAAFRHASGRRGAHHFEHILREIHRKRRGIHGHLLVVGRVRSHPAAIMPRMNQGESIPSLDAAD